MNVSFLKLIIKYILIFIYIRTKLGFLKSYLQKSVKVVRITLIWSLQ